MSKIAEQKIKKLGYFKDLLNHAEYTANDLFNACVECYDQALKDIEKQVEESVIEKSNGEVTIEDLVAYNQGFKTGRELTMQDFMEKACYYLKSTLQEDDETNDFIVQQFKNYIENEM